MADVQIAVIDQQNTQIAVIDQQNTQIALAAPSETEVTVAVPGVQGPAGPAGQGVPSGGTANQVLFKQSGTDYDTAWSSVTSDMIGDLEIVNADVSASAAIAGTKISPDFGAQNVTTTGTATAAALIPSGSSVPTNGVYLPSANNVAISTNGTGRLFVDAGGRVGIGTSSPASYYASKFVIDIGASAQDGITIVSGPTANGMLAFADGISGDQAYRGYINYNHASDYFTFNTAATEKLRITSDGKVGVGTSAPSKTLDVAGTARVSSVLTVGSYIQGTTQLDLYGDSSSSSGVRIDASGNVGINAPNPQVDLHIASSGSTTSGALRLGTHSTYHSQIEHRYSENELKINAAGGGQHIAFYSNTERARIDSSGRLLVGTSSASSNNLLQVNSDALIYGITVGRGLGAIATNTAVGNGALAFNTTGSYSLAIGVNALYNNTTGVNNTATGFDSLYSNTTGYNNVASGYYSLRSNTTGADNVAVGVSALTSNTTGNFNTALGRRALSSNVAGLNNVAIGYQALLSNLNTYNNVAIGTNSLYSNTAGLSNAATGANSLYSNTSGSYNVASGNSALYSNTTGNNNTAIGAAALASNTTASNNTATGYEALTSNTTGYSNVANGYAALYNNTTGFYNVAIGHAALLNHTAGAGNTAVGYQAGFSTTTASNNTAVGYNALLTNTTGASNTAIGSNALYSNTTGISNTATGYQALTSNTTGYSNVANGYNALHYNTTGTNNVATGYSALFLNTTGSHNVANGHLALYFNTTGGFNQAAGHQALYFNSTGYKNIAAGDYALYANTTGYLNTATGSTALYANTTGYANIATGSQALFSNTTGNFNVAIGYNAGSALTTGSNNVIIGGVAGTAGLADTMIFGTGGGTERFRVDSLGNMGIGSTSDPGAYAARLWIDNTTDSTFTVNTTGSSSLSQIVLRNANVNGEARILNGTGGPLTFYRSFGNEAMRIDSSGRLLVGTSTAPTGTLSANSLFHVRGNTATSAGGAQLNLSSNQTSAGLNGWAGTYHLGRIIFTDTQAGEYAHITCTVDTNNAGVGSYPGRLVFSTTADGASSTTERMRITSDGYTRLAAGTGGIQFNGDTAAANALDDYEEGTWTPVPTGWTSITYVSQVGNYVKVGRQVTAWFILFFSGTSAASAVTITGLPFTVTAGFHGGALTFYNAPFDETTGVLAYPEGTVVKLYSDNDGGSAINSNGNASFKYINGFVTYAV